LSDVTSSRSFWYGTREYFSITGTHDIYPRICTDNLIYDVFYVYLTYSAYAIDYYAAMFTRSLDYGETYAEPQNITGAAETSSFVTRPDIAYGTAGLFVAFEKLGWSGSAWATQVWVARSTNYGSSWNTPSVRRGCRRCLDGDGRIYAISLRPDRHFLRLLHERRHLLRPEQSAAEGVGQREERGSHRQRQRRPLPRRLLVRI
jgi:hypothetical protein